MWSSWILLVLSRTESFSLAMQDEKKLSHSLSENWILLSSSNFNLRLLINSASELIERWS